MAYHFATGNSDNILANGPAAWTTKMLLLMRGALANVSSTATRAIVYADSFFFDFAPDGGATNNAVRIGYGDGVGFPLVQWTSGFLVGEVHTVVAVIDITLGSANLKLYADTDATPKATLNNTSAPITGTAFRIGGDGVDRSFDGNLYEIAYWPTTALTGAQCAALGAGSVAGVPMPTNYWGLVADALDMFGGAHGTVTGASVQAHVGTSLDFAEPSMNRMAFTQP